MSATFFSAFDATQPLVNLRPGRHVVKGKINRTTTRRIRRNVDFLPSITRQFSNRHMCIHGQHQSHGGVRLQGEWGRGREVLVSLGFG